MRRSFPRYTRLLLVPFLAIGLVLTGCDSTGSNGGNDNNGSEVFEYPSNDYGAETVANLLAFDLGVRVGNASSNSKEVLDQLYTGNLNGKTVPVSGNISPQQSTYDDIAGGVDLSSLVSTSDLIRGSKLESADSPNAGSPVNTDELLRYYFKEAGANNVSPATSNGIVLSQFAEKMILGTPIYGEGAAILSDFANGNVSSNRAEKWDAAFGYFGFPRTLEPYTDYSAGGEGLASGPAQDIDENGSVDLTSEYVHTWAAYAIERSAAAENNGNANDFAGRAFDALVKGRKEIANENYDNLSSRAQTALDAWEETVAVNVIHYINSMQSNLEGVSGTIDDGNVGKDAWGEAKAFAWGLQFHSDQLTDEQLNAILENIGNDPPYGEMPASDYSDLLGEGLDTDDDGEIEKDGVKRILENAYGFDSANVQNW